MKIITVIAVALGLMVSTYALDAQTGFSDAQTMAQSLDLSDEQVQQIAEIMAEHFDRLREKNQQNANASSKVKQNYKRSIKQSMNADIAEVLTTEQQAKLDQLRAAD